MFQNQQPVLVIMGISGSGKSTVAGILAGQLGWTLKKATTCTRRRTSTRCPPANR